MPSNLVSRLSYHDELDFKFHLRCAFCELALLSVCCLRVLLQVARGLQPSVLFELFLVFAFGDVTHLSVLPE